MQGFATFLRPKDLFIIQHPKNAKAYLHFPPFSDKSRIWSEKPKKVQSL
jgi:hypothetical protein